MTAEDAQEGVRSVAACEKDQKREHWACEEDGSDHCDFCKHKGT